MRFKCTKDDGSKPHFPSRLQNDCPGISDIRISPEIVFQVLKKCKTNSAAWPDGLPPIFLHNTASSLAFPLSTLFRTLIDLRSFPNEWKSSIIIPKFEKGSPSDRSNYCPISLTCTCCKILERIIAVELVDYLLTHNLITCQRK